MDTIEQDVILPRNNKSYHAMSWLAYNCFHIAIYIYNTFNYLLLEMVLRASQTDSSFPGKFQTPRNYFGKENGEKRNKFL